VSDITPLPGASERLRQAGGKFPRPRGRPRKGSALAAQGSVPAPSPPLMRVPEAGVPERCPPRLLGLDDAAAYLGVKRGIALCRRVLIDRRDLDTLIDRSRETSS
jgi:hypothetical protein